jgi:lipopolysaccharide exporter
MKSKSKHVEIGRNTFWSFVNQTTGQFLVLLVFLVTARFVPKEAFGIMAAAMLIIEGFRQILIESLGTTLLSRTAPTSEDYSAGFQIIFIGAALSASIVFLLSGPIAGMFENPEIAIALKWISVLLLTMGLSKMHEIWLSKHMQFRVLALRSIVSILVGGGVGIYMAMHGFGISSLIAQQIVTAVVAVCWLWFATPWRPSLTMHKEKIVPMLQYAKHVMTTRGVGFAGGQADIFFSSIYLGAAATGVFNAAKRLIVAITMIISGGLNNVAFPTLSSLNNDAEKQNQFFLMIVKFTALLTVPLFIGVSILSADLIQILMGEKWSDVAPILSIISIMAMLQSLEQYNANVLYIKDKPHWQSMIATLSALTNIALLIIFAKYGLVALASAGVLKSFIFYPATTTFALRLLGVRAGSYVRQLWVPVFSAFIMGGVLYYFRSHSDMNAYQNLAAFVPMGIVIYSLLILLFDRQTVVKIIDLLKSFYSMKTGGQS